MTAPGEADVTLRLLKAPDLEAILRSATSTELRAFSIACGWLAFEMTRDDQPEGVAVLLGPFLDMASLMVQGVAPDDADIAEARAEARALAQKLDDDQLDLLEAVEQAAEREHVRTSKHPRYLAYGVAAYCYRAAEIVAQALREDAFAGAVESAYILSTSMRINLPTVLAIARANIASPVR